MKRLLGLLHTASLLKETIELVKAQNDMLEAKDDELRQWQRMAFTNARAIRSLAISFRVAAEQPEIDIRDNLDQIIELYSDQIARLEEHFL